MGSCLTICSNKKKDFYQKTVELTEKNRLLTNTKTLEAIEMVNQCFQKRIDQLYKQLETDIKHKITQSINVGMQRAFILDLWNHWQPLRLNIQNKSDLRKQLEKLQLGDLVSTEMQRQIHIEMTPPYDISSEKLVKLPTLDEVHRRITASLDSNFKVEKSTIVDATPSSRDGVRFIVSW